MSYAVFQSLDLQRINGEKTHIIKIMNDNKLTYQRVDWSYLLLKLFKRRAQTCTLRPHRIIFVTELA
jgi:hypothetical protein